jgi:hypothetical protein
MKALKTLLFLFALLSLASCASTDPSFQSLAAVAETNPKPDAIVGLWHRKASYGMGGKSSSTLLCRSDGTILRDILATDALSHTDDQDTSGKWTWHYQGGGVWHPKLHGLHYGEKWILANDHLLTSGHTDAFGLAKYFYVYERTSP